MSDPFASRRREAFQSDRFPDWTRRAACRDKVTVEGEVWGAQMEDDLTYKQTGEYRWPEPMLDAMQICATRCPVRMECLEYSFRIEQPIFLGLRIANDDEYESWGKPYIEEWLTPDPVGVYGGVPGPMRQRFKHDPDPVAVADAWLRALAYRRRWALPKTTEEVA